jgi:hypothetical protein
VEFIIGQGICCYFAHYYYLLVMVVVAVVLVAKGEVVRVLN